MLDLSVRRIFQLVILLILGVALAGGVYLSQKNQETRRGAAGGEKVVLFMPDSKQLKVGETLESTVIIDTGKVVSPDFGLVSGVFTIDYNKSVLRYVGVEVSSPFTVNSNYDGEIGFEKPQETGGVGGVISLMKLKFVAIAGGNADMRVSGDLVFGEIHKTLSATAMKITEEMVAKPDYQVVGEPTTGVCKEGFNSLTMDANYPCGSGGYRFASYQCYDGYRGRVGAENVCYNYGEIAQLAKGACAGRSNCPTTDLISLSFANNEPVVEGKPFEVWINYDTGDPTEKVSSLKMSLRAEGMLEIGEVSTKGTAFSRVDSGNAKDLNLVVMQPSSVLLSKGRVAKLTLTALVTNPMNIYQTGLPPSLHVGVEEVVGIDGEGKPLSFPISDDIRDHGVWLGIQPIRQTLTSTPDICQFCPEGERVLGDANCDSAISMLDFEIWRSAKYDGTPVSVRAMANLDCSSDGVMMADFEVWRKAMFDK